MPSPPVGAVAAAVADKVIKAAVADITAPIAAAKGGPVPQSGAAPATYNDGVDLQELKHLRKTFPPATATPAGAVAPVVDPALVPSVRPQRPQADLSGASKIAGGAVKTAGVLGGLGIMALGGAKVYAAMTAASLSLPPFAAAVGIVVGGYLLLKVALLAGGALGKAGTPKGADKAAAAANDDG